MRNILSDGRHTNIDNSNNPLDKYRDLYFFLVFVAVSVFFFSGAVLYRGTAFGDVYRQGDEDEDARRRMETLLVVRAVFLTFYICEYISRDGSNCFGIPGIVGNFTLSDTSDSRVYRIVQIYPHILFSRPCLFFFVISSGFVRPTRLMRYFGGGES